MNMTSIVAARAKKYRDAFSWRHTLVQIAYLGCCTALMIGIAGACFSFHTNRSTCSMLLLLAVLGIASTGNSVVALSSSIAASLSFSWFFVDQVGSLIISTSQGAVTFGAMAVTAITGSQLAIRAERRTQEAIRRRSEMEKLHQLGDVLLAAGTVGEAARRTVLMLVELFRLEGAVLRIEGEPQVFESGHPADGSVSINPLNTGSGSDVLEICGAQPSGEVRSAIASMIGLVIERARSTEERLRIEAAQRSEELRSTVLNALAHDFRTPLTSIKAAASALRSGGGERPAADHELAVIIDEEADRLDQLIRESLDLARLQAHRATPRRESCNLAEITRSVVSRMKRYLGRRIVEIHVPESLPRLTADRFLLEQMLTQVVDNAGKYSAPGSLIGITGESSGSEVILTVRNEGGEIPEHDRRLIFERFYRGSQERVATEGTGLGLSIARSIAEFYSGRLWLEAEPRGPAFRFALPLGAGSAGPGAADSWTGEEYDHEPHHSLNR